MRRLLLFLVASVVAGVSTVAGAYAIGGYSGHAIGFVGGGIASGVLALLGAIHSDALERLVPFEHRSAVGIGACVGLLGAVVVALLTFFLLLPPLLGFLLVGIGAVVGDVVASESGHGSVPHRP